MCTFICTVCQNKVNEYGSSVYCGHYNKDVPMIDDTTKLYDKSFLCEHFLHIRYSDKKQCKKKKKYVYKFDALKVAYHMFKKDGVTLRPYKCEQCKHWHLTSKNNDMYDIEKEYTYYVDDNKLYD